MLSGNLKQDFTVSMPYLPGSLVPFNFVYPANCFLRTPLRVRTIPGQTQTWLPGKPGSRILSVLGTTVVMLILKLSVSKEIATAVVLV